jgi:hypothetical protein
MAMIDVDVFSATRAGVAVELYQVLTASIGRGDNSADSGLEAFPSSNGIQIRNQSSRLGVWLWNNRSEGELHVQIKTSLTNDGLELADRVISIPAESAVWAGPFTSAYQVTAHEDSNGANPEHTDYIQFRFAVDTTSGSETLALGDVVVLALTIPA